MLVHFLALTGAPVSTRHTYTAVQNQRAVTAYFVSACICMLVISHHIVDFLWSRRKETAPTSIEVLLRPTLVKSDEPSDLRGSHDIAARIS